MRMPTIAGACLACLLSGCANTVFGSVPLASAGLAQSAPELTYALPKAMIPISLSVASDGVTLVLDVGQPVYRPDDAHTYVLSHNVNVANSDTLKVSLDDQGLFIKSLKTSASGEYDAVLRGVAKSAVALTPESQPAAPEEIRLVDLSLDPADAKGLSGRLAAARDAYIRSARGACNTADELQRRKDARTIAGAEGSAEEKQKQERALERVRGETREVCLERLEVLERSPIPVLTLLPEVGPGAPPNATACLTGVCYRPSVDQILTVEWNGRTVHRTIRIPNGQPVRVITLPRPAFADASVTDIEFVNGSPRELTITRPGEAKEAVLLPFNVIGDAISAITSSVLTLETKEIEEQRKLIDAQTNLVKAETALLEAREADAKKREGQAESEVSGAASSLLISMTSSGLPRGGAGLTTPRAGERSGVSNTTGAGGSPSKPMPGVAEDPTK